MNRLTRYTVLLVGMLVLLGSLLTHATTSRAAVPPISTLVAIRAAAHPEGNPPYERVVFQFIGPVPLMNVRYVKSLNYDGSGLPVKIAGNAILAIGMQPAQAHNDNGQTTAPIRLKVNLPNVTEIVSSGDFEAIVNYGIGLNRKSEFRVLTLSNPSRIVIDILNP